MEGARLTHETEIITAKVEEESLHKIMLRVVFPFLTIFPITQNTTTKGRPTARLPGDRSYFLERHASECTIFAGFATRNAPTRSCLTCLRTSKFRDVLCQFHYVAFFRRFVRYTGCVHTQVWIWISYMHDRENPNTCVHFWRQHRRKTRCKSFVFK